MIPETIEDLEKIEWAFIIYTSNINLYVLCGHYEGELHKYFNNEMYTISSIPGKFFTLDTNIIRELNTLCKKDLPFFDTIEEFIKYINRNKIIDNLIND